MMLDDTPSEISKLVEPGRVHRSVYLDRDIFELEMERIFARAWLFVGHTSQIPNSGDYITTHLGRQPVIVCRHKDGEIHVLFNRCSHRGAVVCNLERGNEKRFECLYHGWTYDTNGALLGVSVPDGCAEGFDKKESTQDRSDPQLCGSVACLDVAENTVIKVSLPIQFDNIDVVFDEEPSRLLYGRLRLVLVRALRE